MAARHLLRTLLVVVLLAPAPLRAAPAGSPWGARYWPNVALVTHDGKEVKFYDDLIRDRHVVVSFIFTHCTRICGPITANLARVQREIGDRVGKDIHFLSISMDPDRDTPEVLARYARAYKAGPGWTFLTGKRADIELLRRKFGDLSPLESHSAHVHIGNDRIGQWMATGGLDNPRHLASVVANWLDPAWATRPLQRRYVDAPAIPRPSVGQAVYTSRCAACHLPGDTSVGPDLAGVTARRDRGWLERWLRSPGRLLEEGDPTARALVARYGVVMPDLELTEAELAAVLEYLEHRRAVSPVAP